MAMVIKNGKVTADMFGTPDAWKTRTDIAQDMFNQAQFVTAVGKIAHDDVRHKQVAAESLLTVQEALTRITNKHDACAITNWLGGDHKAAGFFDSLAAKEWFTGHDKDVDTYLDVDGFDSTSCDTTVNLGAALVTLRNANAWVHAWVLDKARAKAEGASIAKDADIQQHKYKAARQAAQAGDKAARKALEAAEALGEGLGEGFSLIKFVLAHPIATAAVVGAVVTAPTWGPLLVGAVKARKMLK